MSSNDRRLEKRRKLEELRKINQEKTNMLKASKAAVSATNPLESVNELIANINQKKSSIIPMDEIQREVTPYIEKGKYKDLRTFSVSETINGRNVECYDEEIQCDLFTEIREQKEFMEEDNDHLKKKKNERHVGNFRKSLAVTKKAEPVINPFKSFFQPKNPTLHPKKESTREVRTFTDEETKKQVLNSGEFTEFILKQGKFIERTLGESNLLRLFDIGEREDDSNIDKEEDEPNESKLNKFNKNDITHLLDFQDESSYKRTVTNLEWSIKHPEILLASYSKSEESNINDPNGLIHIWSMAMRKKPEFQFTCQSELTAALFHKFDPKLIIGATYTGQILIWDTRGKSLPVMKTPPGGKFHSHPVYCLDVTGSPNSSSILSVSNDGVLCTWLMSSFTKSTKRIELKTKNKKTKGKDDFATSKALSNPYLEEMGAICMITQETDANNIFIGTDDSDIYQVSTHQSENQENVIDCYRKHTGPIFSLDMHPGDFFKNANLNHLFLSSSADWTVNLWSKNFSEEPIFTFDQNNDDYIYQAKFHPINPSLFGSIDGLGKMNLWNVNTYTESPIFSEQVSKEALNRMAWSNDGHRIALGDMTGKITLLNITKDLTDSNAEDALKFEKIVAQAKAQKQQI